jgi:hypothetical protein
MTISLDFDLGELPRVFPGHATARVARSRTKRTQSVRTAADFRWLAPFPRRFLWSNTMMTVIRRLFARVCRDVRKIPPVNRVVDKAFQEYYRLPFPPTHYYSPLPDLPSVKRNLSRWYKQSDSPGIDWNLGGQLKLAEDLATYAGETQLLPHFAQVTQYGYGPGYGEVEAYLLYMILRHFKPAQCIEVGSGVSTFYSLNALRANQERDGVNSNMTCIEPYPNSKLRELVTGHRVRLRECEVQDIELGAFEELSANDVLFIDSSHVQQKGQ